MSLRLAPDNMILPAPLPAQLTDEYRHVWLSRVVFNDLDANNHVNNTRYLVYLESARISYMQALSGTHGMPDISLVLAQQEISYRNSLTFGEHIIVGVRTNWIRRSSFGFRYSIWGLKVGEDWRLAADGGGVQVYYDYDAQQSLPLPDHWRQALIGIEGADRVMLS